LTLHSSTMFIFDSVLLSIFFLLAHGAPTLPGSGSSMSHDAPTLVSRQLQQPNFLNAAITCSEMTCQVYGVIAAQVLQYTGTISGITSNGWTQSETLNLPSTQPVGAMTSSDSGAVMFYINGGHLKYVVQGSTQIGTAPIPVHRDGLPNAVQIIASSSASSPFQIWWLDNDHSIWLATTSNGLTNGWSLDSVAVRLGGAQMANTINSAGKGPTGFAVVNRAVTGHTLYLNNGLQFDFVGGALHGNVTTGPTGYSCGVSLPWELGSSRLYNAEGGTLQEYSTDTSQSQTVISTTNGGGNFASCLGAVAWSSGSTNLIAVLVNDNRGGLHIAIYNTASDGSWGASPVVT